MVSFYQKMIFLCLLNVPHTMPDWFAKYQEARIFFPFKKKKFYVFPNSDEKTNMYIILQYWLLHNLFN